MTLPSPAPKRGSNLWIFLIIPALGIIAAVIVLSSANSGGSAAVETPAPVEVTPAARATLPQVIDAPVIDFSLPKLTGDGTISLTSLEGRIVFLNFWATWCAPCERELPTFQQFTRDHAAPDDPIILTVNYGQDAETIVPYLEGLGITDLNVLLDVTQEVSDSYGVFNLPTTFVIDQRGIVRSPVYGEMTRELLDSYIAELEQS